MLFFKNNEFMLFPSFTFIPKTGIGIPKTGFSFSCVDPEKVMRVEPEWNIVVVNSQPSK